MAAIVRGIFAGLRCSAEGRISKKQIAKAIACSMYGARVPACLLLCIQIYIYIFSFNGLGWEKCCFDVVGRASTKLDLLFVDRVIEMPSVGELLFALNPPSFFLFRTLNRARRQDNMLRFLKSWGKKAFCSIWNININTTSIRKGMRVLSKGGCLNNYIHSSGTKVATYNLWCGFLEIIL